MPVVRINDATFANLSTLKTWFKTRSPSETIDRIVRETMEELGIEDDDEGVSVAANGTALVFDTPPSLTFTKPMKATINGKAIQKPNWAGILRTMIGQLKANGYEGEKLVREIGIPTKVGNYEDDGYKFDPGLGISVSPQSAAEVWKEVDRLAKKWRIPTTVEFAWTHNPKAKHPGKAGVLHSGTE